MSYSLSPSVLKNFPIDKYEENYTFIVNNREYKTNRIVADLLSPTIKNNHYNDSSNNKFILNTSNFNKDNEDNNNNGTSKEDYFKEFLTLARFETHEIEKQRREIYSEYFLQLGNISEFLRLQYAYSDFDSVSENDNETKESQRNKKIVENIQRIRRVIKNDENLIEQEIIQKYIEILSSEFSNIEDEYYEIVGKTIFEEIIKNEHLIIQDEDELFEKILKLYEKDRTYGTLFEYVLFHNISEENIYKFVDKFEFEDMNIHIWKCICNKLSKRFQEEEEETNKRNILRKSYKYEKTKTTKETSKSFEYCQGQEFEGIIKYLTNKTGGNIHDNGTIEITTNNLNSNCPPKNVVDFNNDNCFDPSSSGMKDSFVRFDFKDKLIQLTNYSIQSSNSNSNNLKNWNVEVSNDGEKWEIVDRHVNDSVLKNAKSICTFNISKPLPEFYRFIRLIETGCCWRGDNRYDGDFSKIEFFGKLQEPQSK